MTSLPPTTGPEAILHALKTLDLDSLEQEQRDVITNKKKTARPRAIRLLNIISGLKKNEMSTSDLMLSHVPVIPPKFRPFSITGNTFLPGDANELYKDLIEYRRLYERTAKELGPENAGEVYSDMNKAAKAVYGFGESPNPKTRARAVKGFFETVVGTSPKTCYDEETEILTRSGWVLFKDLRPDDEVGTIDPDTHGFVWAPFTNYVDSEYNGFMLHFLSRRQDLLVTPNHRMWLKRRKGKATLDSEPDTRAGWEVVEAASLAYKSNRLWTQTAAASYEGGVVERPPAAGRITPLDWACLIGWYAAEGNRQNDRSIVVWQSPVNQNYCDEIAELFGRISAAGVKTSKWFHKPGITGGPGAYGWTIIDPEITNWLVVNVGKDSYSKHLGVRIRNMPELELAAMLDAYLKGDGGKRVPDCETPRIHHTHKFRSMRSDAHKNFSTVSKRLFDDLQEVMFKLGLTCVRISEKTSKAGRYGYQNSAEIYVGSVTGRWSFVSDNQKRPTWEMYRGRIYCCQVPGGLLVVRRKGKVCVSGNSFYQSKMLSKPVDSVGRGVVVPDADLGMDEVGIPESMAWKLYGNYIQRRLVQGGMSPGSALRHVKDRTPQALKALESEMPNRPVVLTRSPAWFKFNAIGQTPHIIKGDSIKVNTYITEGLNMDFDGDTASVHLPSSKSAVRDVDEKMRPSRMLWSTKNRGAVYHAPKHEQILGLTMGQDKGGQKRRFATEDEAMTAIETGQIDLNDDIEIGN